MCEDGQHRITRGILSYLIRHPDAQDRLDGIVQWWLLEQRITEQTRVVESVLESLVERGLLLKITRMGSGDSYKMKVERIDEIRSILSQRKR